MLRILSVLIVLVVIKCVCTARKVECGYKQCPQTRDGALNVHLIPHSHMDAGWVKTFDEYYHGTRTTISTANVNLIYHSVMEELLQNNKRKFTFSETAYFWRWWKEQPPTTKATFRTLVQEGRVEFAGGGWVQNDEATANYLQIIDQFTWGLRKLNDTLGPCARPKAAWQIDTYGHSREQTSLIAQMGYDGHFIGRVDYAAREAMIDEDRLEFMWRGSDVLGKMSDIMTHTLFNLYNAPEGFCFDFLCSDEPVVDDTESTSYNVEKRVNDFIFEIERQAKYYDHDNILVTMGGDFTYQSAANWYMNMDKIINYVNTHSTNISDLNIFYSTPSCYLKAIYLYGRRDKAIYTERNDNFPYGSDPNTYWTGYFTSRPALKYYVRKAHTFLQVAKQLTVLARMTDSYELHLLRLATSLVLHHDAITGTSQQHVSNDFVRQLSEAIETCTKKVSSLLSSLTPSWGGTRRSKSLQQFVVCHQLNMSQCPFMESQDSIILLVYNPSSLKTYYHVRLPVVASHYSIKDYNDEAIEYQLLPLPAAIINLPGRVSNAIQELYFEAENVPPLGYTSYYISPIREQLEENRFTKEGGASKSVEGPKGFDNSVSNEYLKVIVDRETGLLASVEHVDGYSVMLSQNFYYYSQVQQPQQSGAYSFRPEHTRPVPVARQATCTVVRGTIVKEIRQRFSDWVTQIIRLYRGEEFIELEWIIGPVPIGTDLGKEVVSIFSTNITNNGQFYTDSNGRQMLKRTCWNGSVPQKKLVSSCFYPVTSRICLQSVNTSSALCVLTDRAQGGTSYNEGEIELMVHRRLLTDDGFGLEESLNEEEYGVGLVVRGKHRIILGNPSQEVENLSFSEHAAAAARRWYLEPWFFMTAGDKISRRKWGSVRNKRYSILRLQGLPRHVQVLTLEPWKGGSVLLRLENTLEISTRGPFKTSKPDGPEDYINKVSHITVNLRKLFSLRVISVRETTLAANQWLGEARQMDWSSRYAYQGADDDLLPEDTPDRDDSGPEERQRDELKNTYSAEEREYNRKSAARIGGRFKKRVRGRPYQHTFRIRRAVNSTENYLNNTVQGSFDYNFTDKFSNTGITDSDSTYTVKIDPKTVPCKTTISLTTTETAKNRKKSRREKLLRNISKGRQKPSKVYLRLDKSSEDIVTSLEDIASNITKISRQRRKLHRTRNKNIVSYSPGDDGITKSVYEMYYKNNPFKPTKQRDVSSESRRWDRRKEKIKNRMMTQNYYDYYDLEDLSDLADIDDEELDLYYEEDTFKRHSKGKGAYKGRDSNELNKFDQQGRKNRQHYLQKDKDKLQKWPDSLQRVPLRERDLKQKGTKTDFERNRAAYIERSGTDRKISSRLKEIDLDTQIYSQDRIKERGNKEKGQNSFIYTRQRELGEDGENYLKEMLKGLDNQEISPDRLIYSRPNDADTYREMDAEEKLNNSDKIGKERLLYSELKEIGPDIQVKPQLKEKAEGRQRIGVNKQIDSRLWEIGQERQTNLEKPVPSPYRETVLHQRENNIDMDQLNKRKFIDRNNNLDNTRIRIDEQESDFKKQEINQIDPKETDKLTESHDFGQSKQKDSHKTSTALNIQGFVEGGPKNSNEKGMQSQQLLVQNGNRPVDFHNKEIRPNRHEKDQHRPINVDKKYIFSRWRAFGQIRPIDFDRKEIKQGKQKVGNESKIIDFDKKEKAKERSYNKYEIRPSSQEIRPDSQRIGNQRPVFYERNEKVKDTLNTKHERPTHSRENEVDRNEINHNYERPIAFNKIETGLKTEQEKQSYAVKQNNSLDIQFNFNKEEEDFKHDSQGINADYEINVQKSKIIDRHKGKNLQVDRGSERQNDISNERDDSFFIQVKEIEDQILILDSSTQRIITTPSWIPKQRSENNHFNKDDRNRSEEIKDNIEATTSETKEKEANLDYNVIDANVPVAENNNKTKARIIENEFKFETANENKTNLELPFFVAEKNKKVKTRKRTTTEIPNFIENVNAADVPFFFNDKKVATARIKPTTDTISSSIHANEKKKTKSRKKTTNNTPTSFENLSVYTESPNNVYQDKERTNYDIGGDEFYPDREHDYGGTYSRRKRYTYLTGAPFSSAGVPPQSEEQIEELDYIITLRPTQIRTFVITFDNSRAGKRKA